MVVLMRKKGERILETNLFEITKLQQREDQNYL
jgi:hypothetical protein